MKEILYESTRGGERNITASQAVLTGLAKDGGLYVPMTMPALQQGKCIPFGARHRSD